MPFFLFFKCKYKERGTHCGVSFDIVAYMAAKESLLFYSLKIPLLDSLVNDGTNTMLKNATLYPRSDPVFNIAQ
jgi:hypothetical protein